MKARTSFEKRAEAASKRNRPSISDAQFRWGCEHCFEHNALMRRCSDCEFICMECGEKFANTETAVSELAAVVNETIVTCPHCGRKLKVIVSPNRKNAISHVSSMQILAVWDGMQVVRTIHLFQRTKPGERAMYHYSEVIRRFVIPVDGKHSNKKNANHKEVVMARSRTVCHGYSDVFRTDTPITLKEDGEYYDFGPMCVYPRMSVLPILTRNGFSSKLCGEWRNEYIRPMIAIRRLLESPHYETIAKTKRYDLWYHLGEVFDMEEVAMMWPQIRLVLRHEYRIKDFGMWQDTLDMVRELELDTHSPKYILPDNLKALHDELAHRLDVIRKREEEEKRRARIRAQKEWESTYQKVFGGLLEYHLEVRDLDIQPLHNYDEFCDEGDAMHHCVETYWKRKGSYILSVKSYGKRLATVELSMRDFHIIQCRGKCNNRPARYDEICGLLRAHQADFMKLKPQLQRKKGVKHESV